MKELFRSVSLVFCSLLLPWQICFAQNDGIVVSGSLENLKVKGKAKQLDASKPFSTTFYPKRGKLKIKGAKELTRFTLKATGPTKPPDPNATLYNLDFSSDGQLLSAPPKILKQGDKIQVSISMEDNEYRKHVIELADRYFETIQNLEKNKGLFSEFYGISENETDRLKGHFKYALDQLEKSTNCDHRIDNETKSHIKWRLSLLTGLQSIKGTLPGFDTLLTTKYRVEYRLFKGGIETTTKENIEMISGSCTSNTNNRYYAAIDITEDADRIEFELREIDNLNKLIYEWSLKDSKIDFPKGLAEELVKTQKFIQSEEYKDSLQKLETLVKDISENKSDEKCKNGLELIAFLTGQPDKLLDMLKSNGEVKNWIINWLWLTKGIPKINPFDHQAQPMVPTPINIALERAKLATYQELIAKNAFDASESDEMLKLVEKMAEVRRNIESYRPQPEFLRTSCYTAEN